MPLRANLRANLRAAVAELERAGSALWREGGHPLESVHAATLAGWSGDAELYQRLLEFTPIVETGRYRLVRRRRESLRRHRGTFYTPPAVIDYILELALGPLVRAASRPEDILRIRVLDPAMGGGHFLVAAARYLTAGSDNADFRRAVVENCVFGVDLDPEAAGIARSVLAEFCGGAELPELDRHLLCGDSLRGAWLDELPEPAAVAAQAWFAARLGGDGSPIHWELAFPEIWPEPGGFDAVIGNPPYLSYAGRQRVAGGDELKALYRERGLVSGWASSHSYFMMQCARWIRPGGRAAMIVPDQVGHLEKYGPLRTWLAERTVVEEVRYWGDTVFVAAKTPSLTFCLTRGESRPGKLIRRDGSETERHFDGGSWFVPAQAGTAERLREVHPTLDGFHDPGVHTGNAAANLISRIALPGTVPLLEGKQLRPFGCEAPRLWLRVDHEPRLEEYFRIGKPEVYANTAVILRQTGERPIAARHVHGCAFRNSVLALRLPPGWSVEYVLGLLNSDVVAWLYQQLAAESAQRNFPQVKIKTLRALPLPDPMVADPAVVGEIEGLVREMEAGRGDRERLESLVMGLYGLVSSRVGSPGFEIDA